MEKTIQVLGTIALVLFIIVLGDFYIERLCIRFKAQQDSAQALTGLIKQQNEIVQFLNQTKNKGKW